jgi:hypothetical protein
MGLLRLSVEKMVSRQYDFVLVDQFFRNFITKSLLHSIKHGIVFSPFFLGGIVVLHVSKQVFSVYCMFIVYLLLITNFDEFFRRNPLRKMYIIL